MMFDWNNRFDVDRSNLLHPSDLTDLEWRMIQDIIPPPRSGGNKRTINIRQVVNAIVYMSTLGCQWNKLPADYPPRTSLIEYHKRWHRDGTLERINTTLCNHTQQRMAA